MESVYDEPVERKYSCRATNPVADFNTLNLLGELPAGTKWCSCDACKDLRDILPKLTPAPEVRLIGKQAKLTEQEPEPSIAAQRAIRRNRRRFNTKNTEDGLTCHFCPEGCGSPVNSYGLVCGPCGEDMRARKASRANNRVHYAGLEGRERIYTKPRKWTPRVYAE